ncbi:MAG: MEMO1 family protein [Candidatus Aenigmarchaeota archaeon]|nr:MEMO1 family protein [Candidatus Aenigmarchaeota archaeon]
MRKRVWYELEGIFKTNLEKNYFIHNFVCKGKEKMIIRQPAVAGMFYHLNSEMLKKQIKSCIDHKLGPKRIEEEKFIATVVPHAGYAYSGPVAAWSYSRIPKCNYIILGPNHSGFGSRFGMMREGAWKTPMGSVKIDEIVTKKIIESCPLLEYDILSHESEHSIEVQLPFLQYRFGNDFKFVPICVMNEFPSFDFLDECKAVGKSIANVIKKEKKKWIIIASSDFSHYIPYEDAYSIDNYVIDGILKLNEKDFFLRLQEKNASVCGFGPIAIAMIASKELGAKKGKLLCYKTSGDVTHDKTAVVGYSSLLFI